MMRRVLAFAVCFAVTISLIGRPLPALAVTWTPTITDNFTRANTSVGAAGTTTGIGNNWTDVIGSTWHIASNTAIGITGQNYFNVLTRPASETNIDPSSRIVTQTNGMPDNSSTTQYASIFRYQSGGTYYLVFFTANGAIQMFAIIANGVNTLTVTQSTTCTPTVGHNFSIDANVQGTSPTALAITVTDVTASTVCSAATASDSHAGLQAATGAIGFAGVTNGATALSFTSAITYTPGSPTLAVGDITRTAAAVATSPGSIGLAAAAATGGTAPYTYRWYRGSTPDFTPGAGNILAGKTTLSLTDTTVTNGTLYYYKIVDTDSTATPQTVASNPLGTFAPKAVYTLCAIGDSITQGIGSSSPLTYLPALLAQAIAGALPFTTVNNVNRGISGDSTGDWVSGGTILAPAITACKAAATTHYIIMLGTNDGRLSVSAATWLANMNNIVAYINAQDPGKPIVLNQPPYVDYLRIGAPYTIQENNSLVSYAAQYASVTGTNVYIGDTKAFTYFSAPNNYLLSGDGVHPNDTGYGLLSTLQAQAFLIDLGLSGGGCSSPFSIGNGKNCTGAQGNG